MTIGFAFDTPVEAGTDSVAVEYEDPATLRWIRSELSRHGRVEDLPWGPESAGRILTGRYDVVFNIAEGVVGRNRESIVPAVCELVETPCTGSDAVALGVALDKDYTKVLARHIGIPTPDSVRLPVGSDGSEGLPSGVSYPVIVKPVTGGSSMGIHQFSRATTDREFRSAVEWVTQECGDDALVEEFIPGREFVAGVLEGLPDPELPVAELTFPDAGADAFYSIEWKSRHEKQVACPAELPESTAKAMQEHTAELFALLGLSDLCRADFRLAEGGTPYFIEINPLPGLSPYYSVFPMQAEAVGLEASDIIDKLIASARRRSRRPLRCIGAEAAPTEESSDSSADLCHESGCSTACTTATACTTTNNRRKRA